MSSRVLIVDDDPLQCRRMEEIVRGQGHASESLDSGEAALARLSRGDGSPIAAMILDLVMPDLDGMAVLERLERRSLSLPVIVQTAAGSADAAISAMRAGAVDFLVKPASPERVRVSLANALKLGALEGELGRMKRSRAGMLGFGDIVMHSPLMQRVNELGERAARSSSPVLIEGEAGIGKELVARAIHGSGPRRARPFATLNCAAFPADAVEAVLFGDSDNSSASEKRGGKFAEAPGGTLLLQEIGALPPAAQARLLRALQDRDLPAMDRPTRRDVRLIATTSRRLVELVAEGGFREDLFYRLSVLSIWIPPLRERPSDIPELARNFLARLAAEQGRPGLAGISRPAMEALVAHDWPGNIRQLENAIFRAVALAETSELSLQDFPLLLARVDSASALAPSCVADQRQTAGEASPTARPRADRRLAAHYGDARLLDERGELRLFDALEEEVIRFAVDHYRGHMSEIARRLGIGRSTLYRKLKDYGIAADAAMAPSTAAATSRPGEAERFAG